MFSLLTQTIQKLGPISPGPSSLTGRHRLAPPIVLIMPPGSRERESTRCVDVKSRLMSHPEAETHPAQSFDWWAARIPSRRERGGESEESLLEVTRRCRFFME